MLRNKLAVTVIGVATISLVAGGGAGYWIAHQKDNPQSTLAGQQQDAKVLTAIISRMEYQGLLGGAEPLTGEEMLEILKRYMHLVLASV